MMAEINNYFVHLLPCNHFAICMAVQWSMQGPAKPKTLGRTFYLAISKQTFLLVVKHVLAESKLPNLEIEFLNLLSDIHLHDIYCR